MAMTCVNWGRECTGCMACHSYGREEEVLEGLYFAPAPFPEEDRMEDFFDDEY